MNQHGPTILVFDSGIGGLTIGAAVLTRIPSAHLVYLADNAALPYGSKSEQALIERVDQVVLPCIEAHHPDLIVVACNTASTHVLPYLRSLTAIPVVGVVPAIKPAAAISSRRRIGLLATTATIQRPYTSQLISDFAASCHVTRVGSEELVAMAESFVRGYAPDLAILNKILAPFCQDGVDTVVLGCTHFPILAAQISACLPAGVNLLDSGDAVAARAAHLLSLNGQEAFSVKSEKATSPHIVLFSGCVEESAIFRQCLREMGYGDVTIEHVTAQYLIADQS